LNNPKKKKKMDGSIQKISPRPTRAEWDVLQKWEKNHRGRGNEIRRGEKKDHHWQVVAIRNKKSSQYPEL